jgi:hypothetical protein
LLRLDVPKLLILTVAVWTRMQLKSLSAPLICDMLKLGEPPCTWRVNGIPEGEESYVAMSYKYSVLESIPKIAKVILDQS